MSLSVCCICIPIYRVTEFNISSLSMSEVGGGHEDYQ